VGFGAPMEGPSNVSYVTTSKLDAATIAFQNGER
jgi:hypothetical protein